MQGLEFAVGERFVRQAFAFAADRVGEFLCDFGADVFFARCRQADRFDQLLR